MSKNGTLDDSQLQYFEQQKKNLPFLFKYYLYSHFPDEKEPLFHIIPSF